MCLISAMFQCKGSLFPVPFLFTHSSSPHTHNAILFTTIHFQARFALYILNMIMVCARMSLGPSCYFPTIYIYIYSKASFVHKICPHFKNRTIYLTNTPIYIYMMARLLRHCTTELPEWRGFQKSYRFCSKTLLTIIFLLLYIDK